MYIMYQINILQTAFSMLLRTYISSGINTIFLKVSRLVSV